MNIGFIGLGIMGESMSENIVKKCPQGDVYVYDLNKDKIDQLVDCGAKAADSIAQIGETCDVIISMVPKSEHVVSVYDELLPTVKKGKIYIDMSTISPKVSRQLAVKVKELGAVMLDAPVVKSKPAAISGTLGIYVGGDKEAYEKVKDILECMGNNIIHMGKNGQGLVMKLCHNTLVSQIQNGVNEMVTLATSQGISIDDFVTAISYGGGQNFYLDGKANTIKNQDFTTAFSIENMHKDVKLTKDLVKESNLYLCGVDLVNERYDEAMDMGIGKLDFSATYKVVNKEKEFVIN
jgi:3-hydroxyisobutyrate dehydrogenase